MRCALDDHAGEVLDRIRRSPYGFALAVSAGGVLLGRVRGSALDGDPTIRVEEVMEPGPKTFRPSKAAGEVVDKLRILDLKWALVTDPEGRLIGVASREDLERG